MAKAEADGRTRRALGLMSGTSMDGVDVALLDTDGRGVVRHGPTRFAPFDAEIRALLRRAIGAAPALADRDLRPPPLAAAEAALTDAYAAAIEAFLAETGTDRARIDVVGLHGQTVLHAPQRRLTVQLGDGAALAERVGLPVVFDCRAADVAAGGQGAPLVPVYHRALVEAAGLERPIVVANFGGVANITFIGADGPPIACDTGPASAMVDDLVAARTGAPFDADGRLAATGRVDAAALAALMDHPFFALAPPKSLDRDAFDPAPVAALPLADAAATLVAFSATAFARALEHLPARPGMIVAAGGGARNPVLMRAVARATNVPVHAADALGWRADFVEAEAFAYLAVRARDGLPITFPTTTGVPSETTGGVLARPGGTVGHARASA